MSFHLRRRNPSSHHLHSPTNCLLHKYCRPHSPSHYRRTQSLRLRMSTARRIPRYYLRTSCTHRQRRTLQGYSFRLPKNRYQTVPGQHARCANPDDKRNSPQRTGYDRPTRSLHRPARDI